MDITTELKQFDITDTAIAELKDRYMGLTIKGLDDKEGFQQVHTARMDIVKRRTSVTKTGKDMRAEANAYNKAVLDEEKRILRLLAPIEEHLDAEETRITDEKTRIKRAAEEAEEKRVQFRVDRLYALGMTWDGTMYGVLTFRLPQALVKEATDEQFDSFCDKVTEAVRVDAAQKTEEKRLADENQARLQAVADEQAAERKRLDDEKAALEAEKKRIKDEADAKLAEEKRLADLKEAADKSAAKAVQDEKERVEREAKDKADREKKEADAKKRKEARRPDKEKLQDWVNQLQFTQPPEFKTQEGKAAFEQCYRLMLDAIDQIQKVIGEL
jgi:hypothetical protein